MTAEIRSFPGVTDTDKTSNAQPQQDVIEHLELLLERARSGRVQAVAIAAVYDDSGTVTGWFGGHYVSQLMGAISFLFLRFGTSANDSDHVGFGDV